MAQPKEISQAIKDLEKKVEIYKFVLEKIPDTKVHNTKEYEGFSSKTVNSIYTKFEFVEAYSSLYVIPYIELDFLYNDKIEKIRVNSSPRINRLAYMRYSRGIKKSINFSRLNFNLKNNKFKEDMINACHSRILAFIQKHPGCQINDKYLDTRLKKLLLFT